MGILKPHSGFPGYLMGCEDCLEFLSENRKSEAVFCTDSPVIFVVKLLSWFPVSCVLFDKTVAITSLFKIL